METLFISDLHLSPRRPEKIELFRQLLRGRARQAAALYILGDLFENFWVGNDDRTPPIPAVISELAAFSRVNPNLFIIRGNRDLMLDVSFRMISGCTLLPDNSVIDLADEKVLLAHGDVFCSKDLSYQRYRRFMEAGLTRRIFAGLPRALRIKLAHGLRPWIRHASVKKPPAIIDVEQTTIEQIMLEHGVLQLIHGHTHRPGEHTFQLQGRPATRTVLSDWYENDGVLVWANRERRQLRVAAYLNL